MMIVKMRDTRAVFAFDFKVVVGGQLIRAY